MATTLKATNDTEYGAAQIEILEGLEPVRLRPGMYIGSTDIRGLTNWSMRSSIIA